MLLLFSVIVALSSFEIPQRRLKLPNPQNLKGQRIYNNKEKKKIKAQKTVGFVVIHDTPAVVSTAWSEHVALRQILYHHFLKAIKCQRR